MYTKLKNYAARGIVSVLLSVFVLSAVNAQTCNEYSTQKQGEKVLLQGFWWGYWNDRYKWDWATYLAELAPRLTELGVDTIWIPPPAKTETSDPSKGQHNGYSVYDHYDLGDKYQKGKLETRLGNKDNLLRMIAVMHANSIDVISDVIWNHLGGGSGSFPDGSGGWDEEAKVFYKTALGWTDDKATNFAWKNFRYVSYATPFGVGSTNEYINRTGRWPKNWQNFNPNPAIKPGDPGWNDALHAQLWGPDFSFASDAIGDNGYTRDFDPAQASEYTKTQLREWNLWFKRQTGIDGVRIDAVKHFEPFIAEDMLSNLQNKNGWANGGSDFFAVSEWVTSYGTKGDLDRYFAAVQGRSGLFDFSLRNGLQNIVYGYGRFDMGSLPNYQVSECARGRTVSFINSHDTQRPKLLANGNYSGQWYGENGVNHPDGAIANPILPAIKADDPRFGLVHAAMFAMDGTKNLSFEDIFDIGTTGKRWNHDPKTATELPVREPILNILWSYHNLDFEGGDYAVPFQSDKDHLVLERKDKALIGLNDNWDTWKGHSVKSSFAQGTVLKDYAGGNTGTETVGADGWVKVSTPPCNGSSANGRRGYSVWAPVGQDSDTYSSSGRRTTQEWEMADDLGDSHIDSLQQGGALEPQVSGDNLHTVGNVYVKSGESVDFVIGFPDGANIELKFIQKSSGTTVYTATATSGSFKPDFSGWLTVKARNLKTVSQDPAKQIGTVRLTYLAPRNISTGSETGSE